MDAKGISGDLNTMNIGDILQWCKCGRKTGILTVRKKGIAKDIYFEEGVIVFVASNDPKEYLGQFALSAGKVSETELVQAFERQNQTKAFLGKILVNAEHISEQELDTLLYQKVVEAVYDLFLWEEGTFRFSQENLSNKNLPIRVSLDVDFCVLEGARRYDEWKRFHDVFPDNSATLSLGDKEPPDHYLTPGLIRLFALIQKGCSIEEICLEMRGPVFTLFAVLYELYQNGTIKLSGERKARKKVPPMQIGMDFKNEEEEIGYYYLKFLPPRHIPRLLIEFGKLGERSLTSEEAFILTRINGEWDVRSIVMVTPIQETQALRILKRFLDEGIIELVDEKFVTSKIKRYDRGHQPAAG